MEAHNIIIILWMEYEDQTITHAKSTIGFGITKTWMKVMMVMMKIDVRPPGSK
jgi:hypothetical protein